MQYLLTEKEKQDLVPKNDLLTEQAKVEYLVNKFRDSCACRKSRNMGYCDDCPIGTLEHDFGDLCKHQDYSK
jgi:hypothetical protein